MSSTLRARLFGLLLLSLAPLLPGATAQAGGHHAAPVAASAQVVVLDGVGQQPVTSGAHVVKRIPHCNADNRCIVYVVDVYDSGSHVYAFASIECQNAAHQGTDCISIWDATVSLTNESRTWTKANQDCGHDSYPFVCGVPRHNMSQGEIVNGCGTHNWYGTLSVAGVRAFFGWDWRIPPDGTLTINTNSISLAIAC